MCLTLALTLTLTLTLTLQYLQVQCAAGITKMHDTRTVLPEYLTSQDGAKCWSKVAKGHADTKGTEANNDKFSESVFGVFDRMLKMFHGVSREAASGLSQVTASQYTIVSQYTTVHSRFLETHSQDLSILFLKLHRKAQSYLSISVSNNQRNSRLTGKSLTN